MTMPAGKYYIGDLCYVMDTEEWRELCNIIIKEPRILDGEFELPDGRKFAIYGTAHGDGEYYDQYGHTYSVDAGSIGCILMSDIRANKYDNLLDLGAVQEFAEPFETGSQGGQLQFGHVLIKTDPAYDEDEE
jgi:hypothetical protein